MFSPSPKTSTSITRLIGGLPYRMALAGGWIDQPFVSRHNPSPPGAMLVVSLQPAFRFMDRAGMATSTRKVALQIWGGRLPDRTPEALVRELYWAENHDRPHPSGSQDMAGMIYPGISGWITISISRAVSSRLKWKAATTPALSPGWRRCSISCPSATGQMDMIHS
jgi:hypothetical protein